MSKQVATIAPTTTTTTTTTMTTTSNLQAVPIANDLNTLLDWSTKHHTNTNTVAPMDEQTKQWLGDALKQNMIDPIQRFKQCWKILQTNDEEEAQEKALEEVIFHAEHVDLANDLHKIGAFSFIIGPLLHNYVKQEQSEMVELVLELVCTCAQNNAYIQQVLMTSEKQAFFAILLPLLASKRLALQRKAVAVLAALLSNNEQSTKFLIQEDATLTSILALLTTSSDVPLKRKILVLLHTMLVNAKSDMAVVLQTHDFVAKQLKQCLQTPLSTASVDLIEFCLRIVLELLPQQQGAMVQFGYKALIQNLQAVLKKEKRNKDDDEYCNVRELVQQVADTL